MSGIAIVFIDRSPLNVLSRHVVERIYKDLDAAEKDEKVRIVLICGKNNTFSAGADIVELTKVDAFKTQRDAIQGYMDAYKTHNLAPLVYRIDSFPKPVVALISGSALGGGLEIALGCHYRVALENCTFALPEVRLGIIPGALGTQLLPRLVDFNNCVELCVRCKSISSDKALEIGLIDQVIRNSSIGNVNSDSSTTYSFENCLVRTLAILEKQVLRGKDAPSPFRRTSSLIPVSSYTEALPLAYQVSQTLPIPSKGGLAARAALRCLLTCLKYGSSFGPGALDESEMSKVLVASPESRALRYVFLSERQLQKLPTLAELRDCQLNLKSMKTNYFNNNNNNNYNNKSTASSHNFESGRVSQLNLPESTQQSKFKFSVAVIGSGQMGTGIAVSILMSRQCSVVLIDTSKEALDNARMAIGGILAIYMQRGIIDPATATLFHREHLVLSTDISSISSCDIVIEAVFESVEIKTKLFATLDSLTNDNCILCTNTSSLDIDTITAVVRNKSRVAGLHFFSPAHVMKLVEVIVTTKTSLDTINKLMSLVKSMGKVGVLATDLPGFIGNRMIFNYVMESMLLLEEGFSIDVIDSTMRDFGFPMGPCQMQDLSGLDVGYKIRKEKGLIGGCNDVKLSSARNESSEKTLDSSPRRYSAIGDELYHRGRLGVKNSRGFYNYPLIASSDSSKKSYLQKLADRFIFNSNFDAVGRLLKMNSFLSFNESKKGRGSGGNSEFKGQEDNEVVEIINIVRSRSLQRGVFNNSNNNNNTNISSDKGGHRSQEPPISFNRKEEILSRLLLPLINEGFKLLSEGGVVSYRPSDIDIVYIYGFGFPSYEGGPLYYAENVLGLENTLQKLKHYSKLFNPTEGSGVNAAGYYKPSILLEKMVSSKISLRHVQLQPHIVRDLMLGRPVVANPNIKSKL